MAQRYENIKHATLVDLAKNIILATIKIILGVVGKSHALLADGVHSFADVLTDLLVLVAAKFAAQHADAEHPYGHARFETAASLALAVLLVLAGLGIIVDAGQHFWSSKSFPTPSHFVLWVALFSVVVNELVYRYMRNVAERIQSDLLIANALHSRSDALSSLVVLIGVGGTLAGFIYSDIIAAIIVGLFIIKMGLQIAWDNLSELVDTGLDEENITQIKRVIFSVQGVKAIHELRSRRMAGRALVEVHIIVNPEITVSEAHHIGEKVMTALKEQVSLIENVIVHVDSENDEDYSSTSALPLREELLPLLEKAWINLPGFKAKHKIRLHYLAGLIRVEIELPHTVLSSIADIPTLPEAYMNAVRDLGYIRDVKLLFV
jgi:cation diffusion facilitator family transporter